MIPRVLVVDDEPDVQKMIQSKFRKRISNKELEFVFAQNGQEALGVLESDPSIGVIFTDINMPVMDGLTFLGKLVELRRVYKAVVVSAYEDMSNVRAAMNRGASDYVTKPIDFVDLEGTMGKMLEEFTNKKYLLIQQTEPDVAREVQKKILTEDFPLPFPSKVEISARKIPAMEVKGDFYDFFPLDDHRVIAFIADISGTNISACLSMSVTKAFFRMLAKKGFDCKEIMTELNALLSDHVPDVVVTSFIGIIDIKTGVFSYCNAGQHVPYLLRSEGSVDHLHASGDVALGIGEKNTPYAQYHQVEILMQPGDCVYLYTDGVIEALNSKQEMFGEEKLKTCLQKLCNSSADAIIDSMVKQVYEFADNQPQCDDIAMLAMKIN